MSGVGCHECQDDGMIDGCAACGLRSERNEKHEDDLELKFPGWTVRADDIEAHMWPEHDLVDHQTSKHCVCGPVHEFTYDGVEVYIHYDQKTEAAQKLAPRR